MEDKKMTREEEKEMIWKRVKELEAEIESYRQTLEDFKGALFSAEQELDEMYSLYFADSEEVWGNPEFP